ncbi:enolase C-terminal domain-like protein [Ceratobasidium sp. AG-Ba]|nr:enolase C-terminal domain-like protein [Ceratobasidium sp. AG-Ba]
MLTALKTFGATHTELGFTAEEKSLCQRFRGSTLRSGTLKENGLGFQFGSFLEANQRREGTPRARIHCLQRVAAVKALGMDVGVDFHGRVHKAMAKQLARRLEEHQPLFIEEPLLQTQPAEIADLSQMTTCPIALGERLMSRWDFRPYLERRAIDIAQPDIAHCGGISELRRIASMCEVGVAAPNYALTVAIGADLLTYMLNPDVFAVKNGHVEALTGPGLGIEINEKLVREAAEKYAHEKAWRNATWRGEDGSLREW